jgi:flavin reductase (DIM6/NTAB) family NADH-FMN oxidoreductase RutF
VKAFKKKDFPLTEIRRYLEPGPIVLVSSAWRGKTNIMTMGWHMMLDFSPAWFACYVWAGNRSFEMLRKSQQCVINLPTIDLVDANFECRVADKFQIGKYGLFIWEVVKAHVATSPSRPETLHYRGQVSS